MASCIRPRDPEGQVRRDGSQPVPGAVCLRGWQNRSWARAGFEVPGSQPGPSTRRGETYPRPLLGCSRRWNWELTSKP